MFDDIPNHMDYLPTHPRQSNTNTTTTSCFALDNAPNFDASSYFVQNPQLQFLQLQQQEAAKEGCAAVVVVDPWSNEEVLALLKIISSLDNPWFPPHFTWDNVSRKMAEIGFIRDAKNCKQKFEDETRCFNKSSSNKLNIVGQNYRLFGEFEDLYNTHEHEREHEHEPPTVELTQKNQNPCIDVEDGEGEEEEDEEVSMEDSGRTGESRKKVMRKRKKHKKFEMLKGFCEKIVNKMIAQQEELHCKILQDMIKRDEEKILKEDAWRKVAIDRISKEMQVRAHEQAILGDRQAKILGFLNKFSSSGNVSDHTSTDTSGQVMEFKSQESDNNSKPSCVASGQVMEFKSQESNNNSKPSGVIRSVVKDDTGRRWPRDEVLALINIRCSLFNNNNGENYQDKESSSKGPLWERISAKMMDLGYDRSAKRCKEKWENINKYFRKTKDLNKKRSIDSRTCPYFHQLSHLYNQQGPLHGQSDHPTSLGDSPDNHSVPSTSNVANEVTLVQMPTGFGFEFQ